MPIGRNCLRVALQVNAEACNDAVLALVADHFQNEER
jgi:hypothetical protein